MAGGSLITKIKKAFDELILLQMVEPRPVKFFGAQASGCSPISDAVKRNLERFEPQRPATIARSLAIGNPTDGPFALKAIRESGGWAEDATDAEILAGIRTLAETEAVFAETAGGVTTSVAERLFRQGRIRPEETTVLCVTGNGLKTTEAMVQDLVIEAPISPRFAELEAYLHGMAAAAGGRS
jgi:threonine synthase